MAKNDQVTYKNLSLGNNGTADLKPDQFVTSDGSTVASTAEVLIQNVYWTAGSGVEFYRIDDNGGSPDGPKYAPESGGDTTGSVEHLAYNSNQQQWIRVKNVSGGTIKLCAGGRQTK